MTSSERYFPATILGGGSTSGASPIGALGIPHAWSGQTKNLWTCSTEA